MTTKEAVLIIKDDQNNPTSVVIFNGREHTFYTLERCGMDDLAKILGKKEENL